MNIRQIIISGMYTFINLYSPREAVKGWRQATYRSVKNKWAPGKQWEDYKHPYSRDNNVTSKDLTSNAA